MGDLHAFSAPIDWLLYLAGVILGGVIFYVRERFTRNEKEHDSFRRSVRVLHSKIDHIIAYHSPKMPPFQDKQRADDAD